MAQDDRRLQLFDDGDGTLDDNDLLASISGGAADNTMPEEVKSTPTAGPTDNTSLPPGAGATKPKYNPTNHQEEIDANEWGDYADQETRAREGHDDTKDTDSPGFWGNLFRKLFSSRPKEKRAAEQEQGHVTETETEAKRSLATAARQEARETTTSSSSSTPAPAIHTIPAVTAGKQPQESKKLNPATTESAPAVRIKPDPNELMFLRNDAPKYLPRDTGKPASSTSKAKWRPTAPALAHNNFDALVGYLEGYSENHSNIDIQEIKTAIKNVKAWQDNQKIERTPYEDKIYDLIAKRFEKIHGDLIRLYADRTGLFACLPRKEKDLLVLLQEELAALQKEIKPAATSTWTLGIAVGVLAALILIDFIVRIVIAATNGDVRDALTHFSDAFDHIGKLFGEHESSTMLEACLKFGKLLVAVLAGGGLGYYIGSTKSAAYQACTGKNDAIDGLLQDTYDDGEEPAPGSVMGKVGIFDHKPRIIPLLNQLENALGNETNAAGFSTAHDR